MRKFRRLRVIDKPFTLHKHKLILTNLHTASKNLTCLTMKKLLTLAQTVADKKIKINMTLNPRLGNIWPENCSSLF